METEFSSVREVGDSRAPLVWNGDGRGSPIALWSGLRDLSAALSADGKTAVTTIGSRGLGLAVESRPCVENLRTSVPVKQHGPWSILPQRSRAGSDAQSLARQSG